MYVKLFGSILDSSIWAAAPATRLLWISMLAMADENGVVFATVKGLAHRARISEKACLKALAELEAPDIDSRSPEFEGRRIERIDGGWLLLNYGKYREFRTKKQMSNAARQKKHRAKRVERPEGVTRNADHATVTPVTTTASPSASPSSSASSFQDLISNQSNDEGKDPKSPNNMIEERFGEHARWPLGLVRSSRSPDAVAAVLLAHLDGMHGPAYHPEVVALAAQEYAATGETAFQARLFSGFVRRSQKVFDSTTSRVAARREEQFITSEAIAAERARREEAEADRLVSEWELSAPTQQREELVSRAEAMVDRRIPSAIRAGVLRSALVKLIRDRGRERKAHKS